MPYADHTEKLACQKRYRDKNKDVLNAKIRSHWRYRRSTPEKWEEYKAKKRAWYTANKEKAIAYQKAWKAKNWRSVLATQLKIKFNLPIEQFDKMLKAQGNKCLVCSAEFSKDTLPNVDHCHNTGMVRALLCSSCNFAEGRLKTAANARRLYEYMLKNELFEQGQN